MTPEEKRIYDIEYRKNNKEKIKEYKKEYYKNNKEYFIKKEKEYCKNNKNTIKEYRKEYKNNYRMVNGKYINLNTIENLDEHLKILEQMEK
jgi:hypothetical protein